MLRWNQILRELVARANLPPAPNSDGSIPVPDPNNPFAEPIFPSPIHPMQRARTATSQSRSTKR